MKHNKKNIEEQSSELFEKVNINYSKSKDDVWANLASQINENKKEVRVIPFSFAKMSIAASITLLFGIGLFAKFYSISIKSNPGQHLSHLLPDGSKIELNAGSSINYHPFWWKISRELKFEGEAFFEVEKGSNFAVISTKGTTEVLGTSFNISTKNKTYTVLCKTGKVRVSNNSNNENIVLTPNMLAKLTDQFSIKENVDTKAILGWIKNEFKFSSTPLNEVLKELELQYDIDIKIEEPNIEKIKYTGFFKKQNTPESTLKLICSTFDFTFEQHDNRAFTIVKKK